jgi:hypothetical protein
MMAETDPAGAPVSKTKGKERRSREKSANRLKGLGYPFGFPSAGLGNPSAGLGNPSVWLGIPSIWLGFPSIWLGFPSTRLGNSSVRMVSWR